MLLLAQILVAFNRAVDGGECGGEPSAFAPAQLASHQLCGVLVYGRESLAVRAPRRVKLDEKNLVRANHPFERRARDLVSDPPVAVVIKVCGVAVLWFAL